MTDLTVEVLHVAGTWVAGPERVNPNETVVAGY